MSYLSQFTVYSATDTSGPGYLNGTTGSLIKLLDACLVNGYGTGSNYRPAAGWTKSLPNSASVYGCYTQGSGSLCTLFVNDNSPSVATEAWVMGWETLTSLSSGSAAQNLGTGIGQFPLPSQLYREVWRKSSGADVTPRYWVLFADATTMYLYINSELSNYYWHYGFGDCYSFSQNLDEKKCFIYGRNADNSTLGYGNNNNVADMSEVIVSGQNNNAQQGMTVQMPNHYMARTFGGAGQSIPIGRRGDSSVSSGCNTNTSNTPVLYTNGILACPNPGDGSYYISPLQVTEPLITSVRGTFRGLHHVGHNVSNFSDGQQISGSANYAGKTFQIVRIVGNSGNSYHAVEISPTLKTN